MKNNIKNILLVHLKSSLNMVPDILIRCLFYMLIITIFHFLWKTTSHNSIVLDKDKLTWYLTITELIILSVPMAHLNIQQEIKNGDMMALMLLPVSYTTIKLLEYVPTYAVRYGILMIVGFMYSSILIGKVLYQNLFLIYILSFLSGLVFLVVAIIIGLMAMIIYDSSPLYWIWQKLTFVLGGVLLPIYFYPSWLHKIAIWSPFSALIFEPASLLFDLSIERFIFVASKIFFILMTSMLILKISYKKLTKKLIFYGG